MTKNEKMILAGAGVLGLLFLATKGKAAPGATPTPSGLSYLGQGNLPRGIRNNNPGNLRIGSSAWQGKVPVSQNTDGAFEQFTLYVYGVRAMVKLLQNYVGAGRNTIRKILYHYAPPADNNNTENYISVVSSGTGIDQNAIINPSNKETMFRLVESMSYHENGQDAIDQSIFNEAWGMLSGIGKIFDTQFIKQGGRVDRYHHKQSETTLPVKILGKYNLHSIEYGNWVSQKERLELTYKLDQALGDLAKIVVGVPKYKIGLRGRLSIALGARGSGHALAHFEPVKFVINMTKKNGAGSFAHEWAHAYDKAIGSGQYASGGRSIRMQTREAILNGDTGSTLDYYFENFFHALYFKDNGEPTSFNEYIKTMPEYWYRRTEVWARTFEIFSKIKLSGKGISNRYLVDKAVGGPYPSKALVLKARPWIQKILREGF